MENGVIENRMMPITFLRPREQVLQVGLHDGNKLTLISTAHISKVSVKLVADTILETKPDAIAVELDQSRLQAIERQNFQNLDIIQIIKQGQSYFFLAFLLLSIYQKKMAERTGSEPGAEMKKAVELCRKTDAKLLLIDRRIDLTLKRIFAAVGFFRRLSFLASLISFEAPQAQSEKKTEAKKSMPIDSAEMERELGKVMEEDMLFAMRGEMRQSMPEVAQVLLDERDRYMTLRLQNYFAENKRKHVVAVVGAAHARGIADGLLGNFFVEKSLEDLSKVSTRVGLLRRLGLIVPIFVLAVVAYGFYLGDYEMLGKGLGWWVILNGSFSALGAMVALAHPATIVLSFLAAPLTSLNPAIGVGMVASLVEVYFRPPRVKDFEQAQMQFSAIGKWWSNRLTRALLVFFLTNLGSAIGTWIALPYLANLFL